MRARQVVNQVSCSLADASTRRHGNAVCRHSSAAATLNTIACHPSSIIHDCVVSLVTCEKTKREMTPSGRWARRYGPRAAARAGERGEVTSALTVRVRRGPVS